jgi:hypothetical protein
MDTGSTAEIRAQIARRKQLIETSETLIAHSKNLVEKSHRLIRIAMGHNGEGNNQRQMTLVPLEPRPLLLFNFSHSPLKSSSVVLDSVELKNRIRIIVALWICTKLSRSSEVVMLALLIFANPTQPLWQGHIAGSPLLPWMKKWIVDQILHAPTHPSGSIYLFLRVSWRMTAYTLSLSSQARGPIYRAHWNTNGRAGPEVRRNRRHEG